VRRTHPEPREARKDLIAEIRQFIEII